MSIRKLSLVAVLCAVPLFGAAGCAAPTAETADEIGESEEDLSKAGKRLIGEYDGEGEIISLTLTKQKQGPANKFTAVFNTGIVCITTPCPSTEEVTGTFTAGAATITLRSSTASENVRHLLGRYRYVAAENNLTLYRRGFSETLVKKTSSACADLVSPEACLDNTACQPVWGPSHCSPDGTICTKDIMFKGCVDKVPAAVSCYSSDDCGAGEHCSTEDGICNPSGMLAVCSGTCVK